MLLTKRFFSYPSRPKNPIEMTEGLKPLPGKDFSPSSITGIS